MIEFHQLLIFIAAGIALNLTPGPDMLYTIARSIGQGRTAGLVSALGIGTGSIAHIVAATFGISALCAYSATAYLVLKHAGAVYLIYLGLKTLLSGKQVQVRSNSKVLPLSRIYWQGVVTNVLNPKVALFFISFLPQFVDPSTGSVTSQTLLLGAIFDINGTLVLIIIALLAGTAGQWLATKGTFWKWQQRFTGSVLIALGAKLALPDNRNRLRFRQRQEEQYPWAADVSSAPALNLVPVGGRRAP